MEHSAQHDSQSDSSSLPALKNRAFFKIGLTGRVRKRSVIATVNEIIRCINQMGLELFVDIETTKLPDVNLDHVNDEHIIKRSQLGQQCNLVIVVGGDGSILHAARTLARYDAPVVGINRGRLGFLTDVNPNEVGLKLYQVISGKYQLDQRALLLMEIVEDGQVIYQDMALNDVVLHAGKSVHMIDFQLKIDGLDVYRQHSDGLIVATPTGSTAYALSGGGPIIHPSLDAMCLVPMHPHTLSSRPIVVSGESKICLNTHKNNRTQPMISADGRQSVPLERNQVLRITKHSDTLTLLHPPGFDFYKACRTKLNWNVYAEEAMLDEDTDDSY